MIDQKCGLGEEKPRKKFSRAHPALSFQLHFLEAERAAAGRDEDFRVVRREDRSRVAELCVADCCAKDFQICALCPVASASWL